MDQDLVQAYRCGYERLVSWADLIDRINVFPVADSDTGRNLKISLTPLRNIENSFDRTLGQLMQSATGNSGNIAARFFAHFLKAAHPMELAAAADQGCAEAWQSVANPRQGTMLTLFDSLNDQLASHHVLDTEAATSVIDGLKKSVLDTTDLLPDLRRAQVVDAGALAMFIFFEGFFKSLFAIPYDDVPITVFFDGRLTIARSFSAAPNNDYCVNTLLELKDSFSPEDIKAIKSIGRSVVVSPNDSQVKIHLHTNDRELVKTKLESMGNILSWTEEDMAGQVIKQTSHRRNGSVHIMTDAAGSVSRDHAKRLGLTLLDSYLVFEDRSVPETLLPSSDLYDAMKSGSRVTTAQASVFERHQLYSSVMAQYEHVIYLCVGSVYTGNCVTATQWKKSHDPDNRFRIVDTGAASGRLAIMVHKVADFASQTKDIDAVVDFAENLIHKCQEFIFLDCLKYLVAGGRLSPTSGFFGDLLKLKPVISPTPEGAEKAGVVRNKKGQLKFALDKLVHHLENDKDALILLEYSDNKNWVEDIVLPKIKKLFPLAHVMLHPLSLTSGTHMGPGTWGVAFISE